MICCVSPADTNYNESLNALKYANRARNIQNKPVVNVDPTSLIIQELRRQVQVCDLAYGVSRYECRYSRQNF